MTPPVGKNAVYVGGGEAEEVYDRAERIARARKGGCISGGAESGHCEF